LVAEDQLVFREYLALFEYKLGRRLVLDRQIAELATTPALAPAVGRLQCFRGIQVHSAMVLATELGDWRRFASPRHRMAYLGLVPREDSTGGRERKGSITKAGTSHCRHVLVQAAWSYRHRPKVAAPMKARQRHQPAPVVAHAWKAQHRLHARFQPLSYRKAGPGGAQGRTTHRPRRQPSWLGYAATGSPQTTVTTVCNRTTPSGQWR
jgi:transposase